jgi:hypothetical protein
MTKIRPSLGKIVTKIECLVSQKQLAFESGVWHNIIYFLKKTIKQQINMQN